MEFVWVLKLDHRSVEWFAWVATDLGHVLKVVASLLLDNLGELGGGV